MKYVQYFCSDMTLQCRHVSNLRPAVTPWVIDRDTAAGFGLEKRGRGIANMTNSLHKVIVIMHVVQ